MADKSYSRNYGKYKVVYKQGFAAEELLKAQKELEKKGKMVKYWRWVCNSSDASLDGYIPIYYKKRKS